MRLPQRVSHRCGCLHLARGRQGGQGYFPSPCRTSINLNLKVVRSWKEALEKANAQYQEAKLASACSLENILGRWRCHNIKISSSSLASTGGTVRIWRSRATLEDSSMLQSVVEAVGGLLAIPGESSANISFSLFLLSIGHSHSGSVDLQDQERSVASGKREVFFNFWLPFFLCANFMKFLKR